MDPVVKLVVEIAGILLLGALGEFIFARTRVPDVVWLVTSGILAGPVFGLIPAGLLHGGIPFFGAIALTVILSSGAFRLQLTEVAAAAPRGIFLGLSGFIFSLIGVCGFFWLSTTLGYVRSGAVGMGYCRRHNRRHQFRHYANDGHGSGAFQSSAHAGGRVICNRRAHCRCNDGTHRPRRER
jgi:hypothetical protein